jgi:hypothetical protein
MMKKDTLPPSEFPKIVSGARECHACKRMLCKIEEQNRSKDQIYLAGYLWQIVVAMHHQLIMAKALLLNTRRSLARHYH